jgi:uncharacterized protein YlzI (FlbEa/FlbD family)
MLWFIAFYLILVHAPDGQEVQVNVAEISSIKKPREDAEEHFAEGTRCILTMTNGKFIFTTETCLEITKKIAEIEKEGE